MSMRCPICKRETCYEGNPFRPFCSERCKWIDLDNWLSGRYRASVPVESRGKNGSPPGPENSDGRERE